MAIYFFLTVMLGIYEFKIITGTEKCRSFICTKIIDMFLNFNSKICTELVFLWIKNRYTRIEKYSYFICTESIFPNRNSKIGFEYIVFFVPKLFRYLFLVHHLPLKIRPTFDLKLYWIDGWFFLLLFFLRYSVVFFGKKPGGNDFGTTNNSGFLRFSISQLEQRNRTISVPVTFKWV